MELKELFVKDDIAKISERINELMDLEHSTCELNTAVNIVLGLLANSVDLQWQLVEAVQNNIRKTN